MCAIFISGFMHEFGVYSMAAQLRKDEQIVNKKLHIVGDI